jgi:hypothetical protein
MLEKSLLVYKNQSEITQTTYLTTLQFLPKVTTVFKLFFWLIFNHV